LRFGAAAFGWLFCLSVCRMIVIYGFETSK
jgi:hypothetical protein